MMLRTYCRHVLFLYCVCESVLCLSVSPARNAPDVAQVHIAFVTCVWCVFALCVFVVYIVVFVFVVWRRRSGRGASMWCFGCVCVGCVCIVTVSVV